MTQIQMVLDVLKSGDSITSMEAFNEFGITRLSSIIYDLRKKGYEIASENIEITNRFGNKVQFARYRLVGQAEIEGVAC